MDKNNSFCSAFSDGSEIEVQVNDEFENNTNAESVALSYLEVIGKLPKLFRKDVETVWIHKGNEDFGGGNNNLLIHRSRFRISKGWFFRRSFFTRGSSHIPDSNHSTSKAWINAQLADNGNFISHYAKKYPKRRYC